MSFVCPWCNPGAKSAPTKFRKAGRCTADVKSGRKFRPLVRCNGLVCGTCGQCNRAGEHR